jgi:predicted tellurium resistance membrane protein TerC
MGTRIALLLSLVWMMRLTRPLFSLFSYDVSGRDVILVGGGLFLLAKSVMEIHASLEGAGGPAPRASLRGGFATILIQIAIIDIVFSLDSVITAIGMVNIIPVMVVAIVFAVGAMMVAARAIGDFIDRHPTIKMLALAFLMLVGVALIGEGLGMHIPRGYIYFAMAFSVAVEMLNLRLRGTTPQSARHAPYKPAASRIAGARKSD